MTIKFNQASKGISESAIGITQNHTRRQSLLNIYNDLEFGLTKKDRCYQMCFHIPFFVLEVAVTINNYRAWKYVYDMEYDDDPTNDMSKTSTRLYNYFMWWIKTWGALYLLYVIKRLF